MNLPTGTFASGPARENPPRAIVRAALFESWATPWVALAFIVWPIYVFPAGSPQPITYALLIAITCAAVQDIRGLLATLRDRQLALLLAFVCYAAIVNSVLTLSSQDIEPLGHALYYSQVAVGCLVVQYLLRMEARVRQIVYWSVLTSLVVQVIAIVLMGTGEGRTTLFFGNPNQLSLFALLALAFLLLLHPAGRGSAILSLAGVCIAVLLILLSLSKAAMVAAFLMVALAVVLLPVSSRRVLRWKPLAIIVFPIVLATASYLLRDEIALLNSVLDRLANIGVSADDSLAGRGYLRILEWPQYLVFGAGEGLTGRFGERFEIHSIFGTLLFSYGLPGLVIVMALLAVTVRQAPRQFVVLFVPILLYSLTHQPMRQPMLWALLLFIGAGLRVDRMRLARVR